MSSTAATVTSSSAAPSSTTAACSNLYEIPITEAGCALSFNSAHQAALTSCCKSADVISYFNDCGLYCSAVGQTVGDLQNCLFGEDGVAYQEVFCNAPQNATATNTDPDIPATATASVVAGGDDGDDNGKGGDDSDPAKPSDSGSAAPRLAPELGVSKAGLTIGALLFSAMALGAFQI
ncbi:hypothetical protein GGR51DRAFT_520216 [Nemania sp. FL0031]|nr:hypothetical protein GGR51DRAFT_520216 [Nemania sp. FL0031]